MKQKGTISSMALRLSQGQLSKKGQLAAGRTGTQRATATLVALLASLPLTFQSGTGRAADASNFSMGIAYLPGQTDIGSVEFGDIDGDGDLELIAVSDFYFDATNCRKSMTSQMARSPCRSSTPPRAE